MEMVELNNTVIGIKNSLDRLRSRAEVIEVRSSKIEDSSVESTQSEQEKNRIFFFKKWRKS